MRISCVLAVCNKDNVQNNGEAGVDCGEGGCEACGMFSIYLFPHYELENILVQIQNRLMVHYWKINYC